MNSRSGVNESSLVNFQTDLSSLNQLEPKDGLLSFSFDHIYACHSDSERRQTIELEKEVEISTHCVVGAEEELVGNSSSELCTLSDKLSDTESQNKRLKELLLYHLDLIQQQNDVISQKDKSYLALKQENENLRSRLNRIDRRVTLNQRHHSNLPPILNVPSLPAPVKTETVTSSQPNNINELLIPDSKTFSCDSKIAKSNTITEDTFDLKRNSERDITSSDIGLSSALDKKPSNTSEFTSNMIENKRSFIKKEIKSETRTEPMYTVTSSSTNPMMQRIQRNRKRTTSVTGSLNRTPKTPVTATIVKAETPETTSRNYDDDKIFERNYTVNKKSKMINTYSKNSRNDPIVMPKTTTFTGSLSDRLKLIDTTPTGEDPYQLGEADMREQSPIPKLMLQKSSHRLKVCADGTTVTRRIYEPIDDDVDIRNIKLNKYNIQNTYMHNSEIKKEEMEEMDGIEDPDLDIVKTETEIDWSIYSNTKQGNETSLCDFSYGENPSNIAAQILQPLQASADFEFQDLFNTENNLSFQTNENRDLLSFPSDKKPIITLHNKQGTKSTSFVGSNNIGSGVMPKPVNSRRGRKRAMSTTSLVKTLKRENALKFGPLPKPKPVRGKAANRGKKPPTPGMTTRTPYHTLVGDPDVSWYLGLDPDIKPEDVDQPGVSVESTVEVPRWREKPYTSSYNMEGVENLDDKVFEKRHQKLEAEERRQLRWHMRRVREQRHVERLRQRQRDWSVSRAPPAAVSVWPRPQRDLQFVEITDTLPVHAFGEHLPDLPEANFMLPWVRTSKAMKRSKRSKTHH